MIECIYQREPSGWRNSLLLSQGGQAVSFFIQFFFYKQNALVYNISPRNTELFCAFVQKRKFFATHSEL